MIYIYNLQREWIIIHSEITQIQVVALTASGLAGCEPIDQPRHPNMNDISPLRLRRVVHRQSPEPYSGRTGKMCFLPPPQGQEHPVLHWLSIKDLLTLL
jgi:hypothetical protein